MKADYSRSLPDARRETDSSPPQRDKRLMALAMVIFGTVGLFVRGIALPAGEIALFRAFLAAGTILCFLKISHQPLVWQDIRGGLALLLCSGMAMGFNWVLLFEAYRHTSISVATLSYYFAPLLVTALSPLFFKERMSRWQTLCFLAAFLGLLLVIDPQGEAGGEHLKGLALGLSAALLYAAVILLNKFIRGISGVHRTLLQFFAAILVLLPYVMLGGGIHLGGLDGRGWGLLLVVGVVHTGITYCLYFGVLPQLRGHEIALMSFIDPVVAVLLSLLFLGEPLSPLQAMGGALILIFSWLSGKPPRQSGESRI
ncbi:MAG: DMT family transporter [Christensenellales bacterium]